MRPFERRATNSYPYFKLASWDERNCTWKAGRKPFPSEAEARAEARRPGRYRLTRVQESGYTELEPFQIG